MTTADGLQMFQDARPQFLDAGDAKLAYWQFGNGPPLMCVHGWPLSAMTWRKVLPDLAQRFQVVLPDLAGAGSTLWSKQTDFTFAGQARRLQLLVEHLKWDALSVLAQDTGATVARQLALLEPNRVRKLLLLNTEIPGHRPPWIQMFQLSSRLPLAAATFRALLSSPTFQHSSLGFGGCFADASLLRGEFQECFVSPLLASKERMQGQINYLQGITWQLVDDLKHLHKDIRADVMFVWGEDDPTFPVERGRQMTSQFARGAQFISVPGARLLVHEEKPGIVAQHALGFLG